MIFASILIKLPPLKRKRRRRNKNLNEFIILIVLDESQ
jgi:hypothetical protein